MPIPHLTDTVQLNDPQAGNANAGNGGAGINHGDITYDPSVTFDADQRVSGAHVDLDNGSHFHGDWDAGGGGAGGAGLGGPAVAALLAIVANTGAGGAGAGGAGGPATSNGSMTGGVDAASATANTAASQTSTQLADQHGTIVAGMGGNGGNNNVALGGSISAALVHTDPSTHIDTHNDTVTNTLTDVEHFGSIHDLGAV
jgi:hypothetical protein